VWNLESGLNSPKRLGLGQPFSFAEFSQDSERLLTVSSNNLVSVWSVVQGELISAPMLHKCGIRSVRFSPDSTRVLTAGSDGVSRVWDSKTGGLLLELRKHTFGVICAQFSPNGKFIVTGSEDQTAIIWNAELGQALGGPIKHMGPVIAAQFSPDSASLLTATEFGSARIWDVSSHQPRTETMNHEGELYDAEFSPDGRLVLTALGNGEFRVWDVRSGQPVTERTHHGKNGSATWGPGTPIPSARFSPRGNRIVTITADNTTHLWDFAPPLAVVPSWLPKLGEAMSGLALNADGIIKLSPSIRLLQEVREILAKGPDNDDWVIWGRWVLADPDKRTISPFSKRMPVLAPAR